MIKGNTNLQQKLLTISEVETPLDKASSNKLKAWFMSSELALPLVIAGE